MPDQTPSPTPEAQPGGAGNGDDTARGSTPVRLTANPATVAGTGAGTGVPARRVLGMVPGKPVAGERKEPADDDMVMVWPHLLVRHAVAGMAVTLLVMIIAVFADAPLREVANPTVTPNPEKAPWYFAGLQELLSHFHPMIAGVLIPGAIVVGLAALPYIDRSLFMKPQHRRVAITTFTTFLVLFALLTLIGFAFRGPNWGFVWPWKHWYGEL